MDENLAELGETIAGALAGSVSGHEVKHGELTISENGKNLFWDPKGEEKLSKLGYEFLCCGRALSRIGCHRSLGGSLCH